LVYRWVSATTVATRAVFRKLTASTFAAISAFNNALSGATTHGVPELHFNALRTLIRRRCSLAERPENLYSTTPNKKRPKRPLISQEPNANAIMANITEPITKVHIVSMLNESRQNASKLGCVYGSG
jgi:hypothetical protein